MTNSTTTTTCPKCGRTLELKSAQAHFEDTLSPTASNPNEWARGLRGAATYEGRLYAVCVCTPQGPVLEMPATALPLALDTPAYHEAGVVHWGEEAATLPDTDTPGQEEG